VVGLTAALMAGYQSDMTWLGANLGDVAPYVVMLLVLIWRPTGLLGSKERARV
jgi:branched-chain amino acid transport system permease protein